MPDFDDEKQNQDAKGTKLYLFILLLIMTIGGWLIYNNINTPKLNSKGCPVKGPHSEHVVLFDQTDTVKDKPIVAKDAKLFLEKIKTEVPQYSRLSIYVIKNDPEGKNIEPIISVCNPGDEKNLGFFEKSGITLTVKKYMENWEENFSKIIDPVIVKMMDKTTSPTSPIFEMVNAVSINSFKHSKPKDIHKLIIFSDFMHHTDEYSFYDNSNINFKKFKTTSYYKKVFTSLRDNVYVDLYCYKRFDNNQCGMKVETFWNKYFQDIDTNKLDFHRIGS
ncbi:hypothetical protein [Candidatus Pelagibacter bacterium nBUS_25]|uniref:hypothetical protein n=1 Tax=Candidatus Pelagibacter bacterium nBUS_25 TaxID=3374187 RepID=UPI003EBBE287